MTTGLWATYYDDEPGDTWPLDNNAAIIRLNGAIFYLFR